MRNGISKYPTPAIFGDSFKTFDECVILKELKTLLHIWIFCNA